MALDRFIAAHGSQRKAAVALGVSPSYLTQALQSGNLGDTIPAALGYQWVPGHYARRSGAAE